MPAKHIIIIGSGIGGLTAAALLLKAGQRVTILEAQAYPGGSAGTFYNRGYRFDAGATLTGGFSPGGPHARLAEVLGLSWPVRPVDPAWVTHFSGQSVTQWSSRERWQEERQAAFPGTESFWQLQESLAETAWDISSRDFPWPPMNPREAFAVVAAARPRTMRALPFLASSVASMMPRQASPGLETFLDAQLIISAQTTARRANALYGSAALDLPRRGVNSVRSGTGGLAYTLAGWIQKNGGEILYRQKVCAIEVRGGRVTGVSTSRGAHFSCDYAAANLTPWALADLLGEHAPAGFTKSIRRLPPTWGAFTLYLGLDQKLLPAGATHHQVIVRPDQPLGEGNSVFISLSEENDPTRAPQGMRAATLSTHTAAAPWWALANHDPQEYGKRKAEYTERVLRAAELALPGLNASIRLCLPGTPVTFQFYTGRSQGMVGGFPQTSLIKARSPWTGLPNLYLVGDSIFPGQSTAGVTLGGWRVASAILAAMDGR